MPHDIHQMVFVGTEAWHGLGTPLPANGSYEESVLAAGFYMAVEWPLHSPPMEGPIRNNKALFRSTGCGCRTLSSIRG